MPDPASRPEAGLINPGRAQAYKAAPLCPLPSLAAWMQAFAQASGGQSESHAKTVPLSVAGGSSPPGGSRGAVRLPFAAP